MQAKATLLDKNDPGKFKLKFYGIFPGSYWILKLGPKVDGQYAYSVVSDMYQRTLYLLSRTIELDQQYLDDIKEFVEGICCEMIYLCACVKTDLVPPPNSISV